MARNFAFTGYDVTPDGSVYSTATNWRGYGARELAQQRDDDGYPTVRLLVAGKRTRFPVHCLVANKFLPPRPSPSHQIRHIDGDKTNNRAENLAWGTPKENADDRELHGRTSRGPTHSSAIRAAISKMECR